MINRQSKIWIWLPVTLLALVIFGWRINSVPLTNWDEGIYANVNMELWRSHDWFKLTYFGADFLEKPPLQFWLTMPVIGSLGLTEVSMRFWSVLAGIATATLLSIWAWQVWQKRWVAWLVSGIFVIGRFAVVHAFRTGDLDGLMTFFITWAMYAYWRSEAQSRQLIWWGAATALAIMTKSIAGCLPLIVGGFDILMMRRWRQLGWRNIGWAALVCLAVAAPWHIIESIRFGREFWDSYIGLHVIERTTESLFTSTPWHWYLTIIRDRFFPFSLFLPVAIIVASIKAWTGKSMASRLWIWWSVMTLMIFSLIQTRREWYILPLYPAAALLIGQLAITVFTTKTARWLNGLLTLSAMAVIYYLAYAFNRLGSLWKLTPYNYLPKIFWSTLGGRVTVAVVGFGLMFLVGWLINRRWRLGLTKIAAILFIIYFGGLAAGWAVINIRHQPRDLALKTIAATVQSRPDRQLTSIGKTLRKQPAGYFYLLRINGLQVTELPSGTISEAPLVITTIEPENVPMVEQGEIIIKQSPFYLLTPK